MLQKTKLGHGEELGPPPVAGFKKLQLEARLAYPRVRDDRIEVAITTPHHG